MFSQKHEKSEPWKYWFFIGFYNIICIVACCKTSENRSKRACKADRTNHEKYNRFDTKNMQNPWFSMTNPRTHTNHWKMPSRSQLLAILTDFEPFQGVPKSSKTTKKAKKSETKKSLKNSPPAEPPKMSFDSLGRCLTQIEGVQVLATWSQENPNFAWKVLHFLFFCKSWFFKPQGGIDNPQLACAAPCRT